MKAAIIQKTSGASVARGPAITRDRLTPLDVSTAQGSQEAMERTQRAVEALNSASSTKREMLFVDVACTSGQTVRLCHKFNGRVFWSLIDWVAANTTDPPEFARDASPDDTANVLTLQASKTGTASFRVWQ